MRLPFTSRDYELLHTDDGAKRARTVRWIGVGIVGAVAVTVLLRRAPSRLSSQLEAVVRFDDLPRRTFVQSIPRRSAPALIYTDELPASTFSAPQTTVVYSRDVFAASSPLDACMRSTRLKRQSPSS